MDLRRASKPRPRSELVMRAVRPLAASAVARLAHLGVDPVHVVLAHGALGASAAAGIAAGTASSLAWAAALLAGKVLLDNVDGGLARATGRVTLSGRYLDTLVDFVVNVALFAALATHGPVWAAGGALAVLTIVLSLDYNLERLYLQAREAASDPAAPAGAPAPVYGALRAAYGAIFAPQDRAVEAVDGAAGRWLAGRAGVPFDAAARSAWNDLFSTATLVNLGLSTQLLALAVLCAAGIPFAYVGLVWLQAAYVVCVSLLRAARFRAYLRTR